MNKCPELTKLANIIAERDKTIFKTAKKLAAAQTEVATLGALVRESVTLGISGDGICWFCAFCGNHGSEKLHYDNCFSLKSEVKAIMEEKPLPENLHNFVILPVEHAEQILAALEEGTIEHIRLKAAMEGEEAITPSEYLKRPYSWCFIPIFEDGEFCGYATSIREFPGCLAQGKNLFDAEKNLHDAAYDWIAAALSRGQEIPEVGEEKQ